MPSAPICKYCKLTLKWPAWTGKSQRPVEINGKQHDCPKFARGNGEDRKTWIKLKSTDFRECFLCGHFILTEEAHKKYPTVNYMSMNDHNKMWHPNGEKLDFVDFKAVSKEDKAKLRVQMKMCIDENL